MLTGAVLLDAVATRICSAWLTRAGASGVIARPGDRTRADITCSLAGVSRAYKVKADPYFGIDRSRVDDRAMTFYRQSQNALALEAVADAATREPGWMFGSPSDAVLYLFIAIAQPEDEVRALLSEPDAVFFGELAVERDELVELPMEATRAWFESSFERYPARPVMSTGASSWYRLVPRGDLESSVAGIKQHGSIFKSLSR